jgi:transposase
MGTDLTHSLGEIKVSKRAAGKAFNALFETAEALTANEESIIDQAMAKTHRDGTSPLLDAMARAREGTLKPNMSREILAYYKEHAGFTTAQGAADLADKFEAHYSDINDAFKRIRNLINTMCHAKGNQRGLEKRGGKPGRGNAAQVFVVAEAA